MDIAIVLRGDRGLELTATNNTALLIEIAIVLRGDRGLEHLSHAPNRQLDIAIVLRGDRGLEPVDRGRG